MKRGRAEADTLGLRGWDVFAVDVEGTDEKLVLHIGFPEKKVCVYLEEGEKFVGWHPLPVGSFIAILPLRCRKHPCPLPLRGVSERQVNDGKEW